MRIKHWTQKGITFVVKHGKHAVLIAAFLGFAVPAAHPAPLAAPVASKTPREDHRRGFLTYTTHAGETWNSVAERHGVDPVTLIWANSHSGAAFFGNGETLLIPPASGRVVPSRGESAEELARAYGGDAAGISTYNVLPAPAGSPVLIPGARDPEDGRLRALRGSGYNALNIKEIPGFYWQYGGRYPEGWCTTWVVIKRGWVPWTDHARNWIRHANAYGWPVSNAPKVGSIFAEPWSVWGHVSVVVATMPDGSFVTSEMPALGLGHANYRWVPAQYQGSFIEYPQ